MSEETKNINKENESDSETSVENTDKMPSADIPPEKKEEDELKKESEKEVEKEAEKEAEKESSKDEKADDSYTDTVYFANSEPDAADDGNNFDAPQNNERNTKAKGKRISLKAFVISLIAVIVASVMLTYSIANSIFKARLANAYYDAGENAFVNGAVSSTGVSELDVIAEIINSSYYGSTDPEELMEAAIDAYVKQTGDVFAAYYTQEELDALHEEDVGKMTGIGVNIINSTVTYKDSEVDVLKIVNVVGGSPAEKNGVKAGDCIYSATVNGSEKTVDELGYEDALDKLLGEVGSVAEFKVLRDGENGLELVSFKITRETIITDSVYARIPEVEGNADKKIGVIKITNFDFTTPTQFSKKIDELKANGCEKFVIDVRYNPGGYEVSIQAVLSYFLNEGDVYIRTKDKNGKIESSTIQPVSSYSGDYAGCNVSKEDIGKYKDLDVVVLCNEYTASAGELFVATFKDYSIGKVVGTKTYGKGTMQTTFNLQSYAIFNHGTMDIDGAVKITTHEYFSAKSDSYNGIGIDPNEKIELSEEAKKMNVYDYDNLDKIDDQLIKAINILNSEE